jgi:hypothetical protein
MQQHQQISIRTLGDENLYLKGGEGSMSIINFWSDADNNGVVDELNY